ADNQLTFTHQQKNPQAIKTREAAQQLVQQMSQTAGTVEKIEEKVKRQAAPLPYGLTEIQREANQRYGVSDEKTVSLVQSIYENNKVVTYPRTDSKYFAGD